MTQEDVYVRWAIEGWIGARQGIRIVYFVPPDRSVVGTMHGMDDGNAFRGGMGGGMIQQPEGSIKIEPFRKLLLVRAPTAEARP